MMRGCLGEFNLAGLVDGLDELTAEITSTIASNCAWKAVSREDVVGEEVQDFLTRWFTLDRDRLDPPRKAVGEDHQLGVSSSSGADVGGHVKHVAHQTVEGVRADIRREASSLATVRTLGKAALVAS